MAEPTVPVPVSLIRDAVVSIRCEQYDGPLVRRLDALLSQPTPSAEEIDPRSVRDGDLVTYRASYDENGGVMTLGRDIVRIERAAG